MITVQKEVLVERPADEVFDFLADVRNEERWNPNVLRIESDADGPLAVGGTFEGVYRRGGRMRFELVEALRPSRLVFRGGGRQMTLVGTLELEQAGSATRVRMKGEMEPRGLMKLLAPLMRKPIERQYATVAETFRQVAATESAETSNGKEGVDGLSSCLVLRRRALLGRLGRDLRRADVTRLKKGSAITRMGAQRLEPALALSRIGSS